MGSTAAIALWGVEGLLFILLVRIVRDRRRLARMEEELAGAGNGPARSRPSSHQRQLSSQWPEFARQLREEGRSAAEIEQVRQQLFSA